jgi:hypothetical protein
VGCVPVIKCDTLLPFWVGRNGGPITEQHTRTQTGSLCNSCFIVRTCVSTQSDGVDQAMSSSTSCNASAAKIGGRSLILASLKGSKLASSSLTSEDVCSTFNYQ